MKNVIKLHRSSGENVAVRDALDLLANYRAMVVPSEQFDNRSHVALVDRQRWALYDIPSAAGTSYRIHQYLSWGVETLLRVLGLDIREYGEDIDAVEVMMSAADLAIHAVTVERAGKFAAISIGAATDSESVGMRYRPALTFFSSLNGTMESQWRDMLLLLNCMNEMPAFHAAPGHRAKHTKHSRIDIGAITSSIPRLHAIGEQFGADLEWLAGIAVSTRSLDAILSRLVPVPAATAAQSAHTRSDNRRAEMRELWESDERVTPWRGTALGVLQMGNTYRQHMTPTRGDTDRDVRTATEVYSGAIAANDRRTLAVVADVVGFDRIMAIAGAN